MTRTTTPRRKLPGALLASLSSLVVAGCVHLNSVSMTQIPAARTAVITAEASRMIILGLNFDNDYVDDVRTQLKAKCPGGEVKGILTKDEVIDYFLFVQKRRVAAEGFCMQADGGAA